MAPTRGMLLKGLFFPNKRPFPFPPFPHDPKKGGGAPIRAAAPPLLPILTAPRPATTTTTILYFTRTTKRHIYMASDKTTVT